MHVGDDDPWLALDASLLDAGRQAIFLEVREVLGSVTDVRQVRVAVSDSGPG